MSGAENTAKGPAAPKAQRRSVLGGLLLTLLLAALILLVFGIFAARTEGCRAYVEEAIQQRTGTRFLVGKTMIGWPYDLVLENVRLERAPKASDAGLTVREMRLGVRPDLQWHLALTGCNLALQKDSDGLWQPAFAGALGSPADIARVSALAVHLPARVCLEVQDGTVEWLEPKGTRTAFAKGVRLWVTPIALSGRSMFHWRLMADEVLRAGGGRIYDIEREWLYTEKKPYLEIDYRADWKKASDERDFWSPAVEPEKREADRAPSRERAGPEPRASGGT